MDESMVEQIQVSQQASRLLAVLKDFDYPAFLEWYRKEKLVIGPLHILEFIDRKGRGLL